MGTNKEGNCYEGVHGGFLDKFKSERLVTESEEYRAVKEVLLIGRTYYLDILIILEEKQRLESDSILLREDKRNVDKRIDQVLKDNDDNLVFVNKFKETWEFIMSDLKNTSSIMLSNRFVLLQKKIQEAEERTDLV